MSIGRRLRPLFGLWITAWVALPAAAAPETVQYETEDGVVIHATYHPAQGALKGAAVYLHQPGRSRGDWDYIADKLAERGVAGLAPDLRGHGDSVQTATGGDVDRDLFTDADFLKMVHDVQASVLYLRDERAVGEHGVQLVGADVGGSAALLYAVEDPAISTLVLLSPGLMYDGVDTVGQVAAYGNRPLLLVVSVEDSYAAKSADVLSREARGVSHLQIYYGVGHGTKMLNREPELEQLLASWLVGTFQTKSGDTLAGTMLKIDSLDKSTGTDDSIDEEARARAEADLKEQREATAGTTLDDEEEEEDDQPQRWD